MFIHPYLAKASLGLGVVFALIHPAFAQITPNGLGTVVNPQGNQINISGGTQAGGNLFHSFRDFNVNSAQIANFLSNPQIQNILARVNGGNPSLINGLLQVTGGNSNLFLMNPAGIVFGRGASLNVPASFTATTANQIGFGNNLFNAFGDNNFSALVGNPDSFVFTTNQAGSIVNAGNLAVGNGQNLSLIGGNAINTGRLTAPGGEIQVLAVPGTNRVRLSQPGQVLSLEIVPPVDGVLRAVDLPALLTGSDLPGIGINPTGLVQVAGTSLPNQQGIAVASGRIDVSSATGNGGVVQVMGDRVAALDARINANGATGGGTVRLGGEYLGGRDTGIAPALRFNSQRTLVDRNSLIRANATVTGEGGRVIVWADRNTGYFGRITGRGATGRGAFVEISGRENLAFDGRVEIPGVNGLVGSLLLDPANIIISAATTDDAQIADATILVGDLPANMFISAAALGAIPAATPINIAASNNITFNVPVTFAACTTATCGAISFTAGGTFNALGNSIIASGRAVSIKGVNIALGTLSTSRTINAGNGGAVSLNATGTISAGDISTNHDGVSGESAGAINITTNGDITTGQVTAAANVGNGAPITISGANITTALLGASSYTAPGNSAAVTINATGNVTTGDIQNGVNATGVPGIGGAVSITAEGNIITNLIATYGQDGNGLIRLIAGGDIQTGPILANSDNGTTTANGGVVILSAPNGNIQFTSISSQSRNGTTGFGGNVVVNAGGLVRATGTLFGGPDRNGTTASISTAGGAGGGAINIFHAGGSNPFIIGGSSTNGTISRITSGTGANTINIGSTVPVGDATSNFGTNISIVNANPFPPPTRPDPQPPTRPPLDPPPKPDTVTAGSPEPEVVQLPVILLTAPEPSPPPAPEPVPPATDPVPEPPAPDQAPEPPTPPKITISQLTCDVAWCTLPPNLNVPSIISTNAESKLPIITRIPASFTDNSLVLLEEIYESEFREFADIEGELQTIDIKQTQDTLERVSRETNTKPALLYVFFSSPNNNTPGTRNVNSARSQLNRTPSNTDTLEIFFVPPSGELIRLQYPGLRRSDIIEIAGELTRGVARNTIVYPSASKRMHELLIAPLEAELKKLNINNLVFLMDAGLRSMPIAAIQNKDGRFIIEDYSVGLMPSLTLTNTTYGSLKDSPVTAMGADRFLDANLKPLPGVPIELSAINQIRGGNIFLNENFTLSNLRLNRRPEQRILHLATHGSFLGDKTNTYIQLWGTERLTLEQIRTNGFGNPPVDLLVLSACETALGNTDAELGFAGLAVTSGVRSALASLWQVSDEGTMGLMTEFYQQLQTTTTKSEALRQAQLAMLRGEVRLEGGNLVTPKGNFALNDELKKMGDRQLKHPYYWSAFTMIGNPW